MIKVEDKSNSWLKYSNRKGDNVIKKILLLSFCYLMCIVSFGCETKDNEKLTKGNSENIENCINDPTMNTDDEWAEVFPDLVIQKDGENITASTEKQIYNISETQIICDITNNKKGIGFYIYSQLALEKLENEEWIRVEMREPYKEGQWIMCVNFTEDAANKNFSTRYIIKTEDIKQPLTEGVYRIVCFLPDRKIYAPFNVEEDKE